MDFDLNVALTNGTAINLTVGAGDVLFVLGANGTGKSNLMHRF